MAAGKRSKRERQQGVADGTRVEGRDGGGGCLGGDDGGEANALSWRRAASPGKRHLGVLPRGALRVLQDTAIGSDERPSEIRARRHRVPSTRHEPLVASRRPLEHPSVRASRAHRAPLFALSSWLRTLGYSGGRRVALAKIRFGRGRETARCDRRNLPRCRIATATSPSFIKC